MSDQVARQELETRIVEFGQAWRVLGRDAWLDYAHGRSGADTQISFADVSTRLVGNVAIITGRNDMTGQSAISSLGRSIGSLRFTQVWVCQKGRWRRKAFQATFVTV